MTGRGRRPVPPVQRASDEALRGAELAFGKNAVAAAASSANGGVKTQNGIGRGRAYEVKVKEVKGDNGALAAARSVGRVKSVESQHSGTSVRGRGGARVGARGNLNLDGTLSRQNTGASIASNVTTSSRNIQPRPRLHSPGTSGQGKAFLQPQTGDKDIRSPSFIAATLAASRSASLSPNPTGRNVMGNGQRGGEPSPVLKGLASELRIPERRGSRSPSLRSGERGRGKSSIESEIGSKELVLDERSIPSTGKLVGMFERNAGAGDRKEEAVGKRGVQERGYELRVRMPSPLDRKMEPGSAVPVSKARDISPHKIPERTASTPTRIRTPSPLITRIQKSPPQPRSPKPIIRSKSSLVPPSLTSTSIPSKRRIQPLVQERTASLAPSTTKSRPVSQQRKTSLLPSKPIPVLSKTPQPIILQPQNSASSAESFFSASEIQAASYEEEHEYKPSWRAELASRNRRGKSASLYTVDSHLNEYKAVNSLADAIVASSLASSRAASPSKSLKGLHPPLPPPRRTKHHHSHNPAHLFHNGKNDISRTPSPGNVNANGGAVLRTTMRKEGKKEEIDEGEKRRGRRGNVLKKAPNKHHEGDRKRWRDTITERERKRYEAVWASNRGLFTGDGPGKDMEVCNLVIRDIWSRSRLEEVVLEEVYALVDRRGIGGLEREEFVVGLWLVDQRLKGRKLPPRVGESVWKSVGVLSGIKVRKMK